MWLAVYLFWLFLLGVAFSAFRWGGRDERCVATAYVAATIATLLLRLPGQYASLNIGVATVDVGLLVVLLCLVTRTARWWLVLSAALQLVTVLGHVAMFDGGTRAFDYFMTVVSSSYPAVLLLAYATLRHVFRRDA
ncbi:hypothetical protein [Sphingomonas sp. DC2300-3]|uniref:hypothetical protein n=1 Tax=unclassified Sphingomonas TaxID=196159 RepID=UPI003CE7BCFE